MRNAWAAHLFLLALTPVGAQNLVNNPGFEQYTIPPSNYGQICLATGWTTPSGICSLVVGTGSPEFYHTAGSGGAKPPATYWANLMPHTGGGMSAICPWYWTNTNFKEYIRTSLTQPLVVGQTYEVSFWLTNGVSTIHPYGVNFIAAAFSTTPLVQVLGNNIAYTPQVEIPTVVWSTTWQYHSYTFTAAQPYQYVCFGSFRPWAAHTYQYLGSAGTSGSLYYIDDISVTAITPLPVELTEFTATVRPDERVECEWTTATETNSAYFLVERSADGADYAEVGSVQAAGNSQTATHYSLWDEQPLQGLSYYRLTPVDADGSSGNPQVRAVTRYDAATQLVLFADVMNELLYVQLPSEDDGEILLYDSVGRLLHRQRHAAASGRTAAIRTNDLPDGVYLAVFSGAGGTASGRCAVVR